MNLFGFCNFHRRGPNKGTRKTERRGANDEIRAKQMEYQNSAIYKAFEFFVKIALGVGGASGIVLLQQSSMSRQGEKLLEFGGLLLWLSAVIFSIAIALHNKSKIERWDRDFSVHEPLLWVEHWYVQGMVLLAFGYGALFLPFAQGGDPRGQSSGCVEPGDAGAANEGSTAWFEGWPVASGSALPSSQRDRTPEGGR